MDKLITQDECQEIIKQVLGSENFKIGKFEIVLPNGDYPGFCAEYCKIKIDYTDVSCKNI